MCGCCLCLSGCSNVFEGHDVAETDGKSDEGRLLDWRKERFKGVGLAEYPVNGMFTTVQNSNFGLTWQSLHFGYKFTIDGSLLFVTAMLALHTLTGPSQCQPYKRLNPPIAIFCRAKVLLLVRDGPFQCHRNELLYFGICRYKGVPKAILYSRVDALDASWEGKAETCV